MKGALYRMNQEKRETYTLGKQSIELKQPVFIRDSASVVGTKEGQGPLAELFDMIGQDDMFGCASWEEAESRAALIRVLIRFYV